MTKGNSTPPHYSRRKRLIFIFFTMLNMIFQIWVEGNFFKNFLFWKKGFSAGINEMTTEINQLNDIFTINTELDKLEGDNQQSFYDHWKSYIFQSLNDDEKKFLRTQSEELQLIAIACVRVLEDIGNWYLIEETYKFNRGWALVMGVKRVLLHLNKLQIRNKKIPIPLQKTVNQKLQKKKETFIQTAGEIFGSFEEKRIKRHSRRKINQYFDGINDNNCFIELIVQKYYFLWKSLIRYAEREITDLNYDEFIENLPTTSQKIFKYFNVNSNPFISKLFNVTEFLEMVQGKSHQMEPKKMEYFMKDPFTFIRNPLYLKNLPEKIKSFDEEDIANLTEIRTQFPVKEYTDKIIVVIKKKLEKEWCNCPTYDVDGNYTCRGCNRTRLCLCKEPTPIINLDGLDVCSICGVQLNHKSFGKDGYKTEENRSNEKGTIKFGSNSLDSGKMDLNDINNLSRNAQKLCMRLFRRENYIRPRHEIFYQVLQLNLAVIRIPNLKYKCFEYDAKKLMLLIKHNKPHAFKGKSIEYAVKAALILLEGNTREQSEILPTRIWALLNDEVLKLGDSVKEQEKNYNKQAKNSDEGVENEEFYDFLMEDEKEGRFQPVYKGTFKKKFQVITRSLNNSCSLNQIPNKSNSLLLNLVNNPDFDIESGKNIDMESVQNFEKFFQMIKVQILNNFSFLENSEKQKMVQKMLTVILCDALLIDLNNSIDIKLVQSYAKYMCVGEFAHIRFLFYTISKFQQYLEKRSIWDAQDNEMKKNFSLEKNWGDLYNCILGLDLKNEEKARFGDYHRYDIIKDFKKMHTNFKYIAKNNHLIDGVQIKYESMKNEFNYFTFDFSRKLTQSDKNYIKTEIGDLEAEIKLTKEIVNRLKLRAQEIKREKYGKLLKANLTKSRKLLNFNSKKLEILTAIKMWSSIYEKKAELLEWNENRIISEIEKNTECKLEKAEKKAILEQTENILPTLDEFESILVQKFTSMEKYDELSKKFLKRENSRKKLRKVLPKIDFLCEINSQVDFFLNYRDICIFNESAGNSIYNDINHLLENYISNISIKTPEKYKRNAQLIIDSLTYFFGLNSKSFSENQLNSKNIYRYLRYIFVLFEKISKKRPEYRKLDDSLISIIISAILPEEIKNKTEFITEIQEKYNRIRDIYINLYSEIQTGFENIDLLKTKGKIRQLCRDTLKIKIKSLMVRQDTADEKWAVLVQKNQDEGEKLKVAEKEKIELLKKIKQKIQAGSSAHQLYDQKKEKERLKKDLKEIMKGREEEIEMAKNLYLKIKKQIKIAKIEYPECSEILNLMISPDITYSEMMKYIINRTTNEICQKSITENLKKYKISKKRVDFQIENRKKRKVPVNRYNIKKQASFLTNIDTLTNFNRIYNEIGRNDIKLIPNLSKKIEWFVINELGTKRRKKCNIAKYIHGRIKNGLQNIRQKKIPIEHFI
jgi:hypothetical protein